ncbi:UNVERIFIED_CONTAM: hypothetical protein GTU68_017744 [Idotea baltica]|nr:hypothetical protein [Idotea baltica]
MTRRAQGGKRSAGVGRRSERPDFAGCTGTGENCA